MKTPVKLYIAISNYLIQEGLNAVFDSSGINIIGRSSSGEETMKEVFSSRPDVLIIDYAAEGFSAENVFSIMRLLPELKVIAITAQCDAGLAKKLLNAGLHGHLMSDCDRDEILDSVKSLAKGKKFFCGKVLDKINALEGQGGGHGCDPVSISGRELEILQLVADGLTTKQIAEKLHLSFHTVMTHRKNMMNKLGIKNTAGLIIYAVKENLITPNKFLFSTN